MKPTVLLTGASGYLGAAIARRLRIDGFEVLTAGRRRDDDLLLDLSNPEAVARQSLPSNLLCCIHAAAANEVACRADPVSASTINVTATRALLESVTRAGIGRFVYLSTFHVFGSPEGDLNERTPPCPLNDYSLTHWMAEQFVRQWELQTGGQATVVRPANAFGEPAQWASFRRWSLAPFDFIRQAMLDSDIRLLTDGSPVRAYVSTDAVSRAASAAAKGEMPRLVHAGGSTWSMKALAEAAAEVTRELTGRIVKVRMADRSSGERPYVFSSEYLPPDLDHGGRQMRAFLRAVARHLSPAAS